MLIATDEDGVHCIRTTAVRHTTLQTRMDRNEMLLRLNGTHVY